MKRTKSSVDYSRGKPSAHCGICRHFRPTNACTLVEGRISKDMWCRLFERRQTSPRKSGK